MTRIRPLDTAHRALGRHEDATCSKTPILRSRAPCLQAELSARPHAEGSARPEFGSEVETASRDSAWHHNRQELSHGSRTSCDVPGTSTDNTNIMKGPQMPHETDVFHFFAADIPLLKSAARLHMRDLPPGFRLEVLARALGYRTYAALLVDHASREAGEIMVCLDPETATDFAQSHGHFFDADVMNAVLDEVEDARCDQEPYYLDA